jgi:hypothetical protein
MVEKLCAKCHKRPAKYVHNGYVGRDAHHDMCLECYRRTRSHGQAVQTEKRRQAEDKRSMYVKLAAVIYPDWEKLSDERAIDIVIRGNVSTSTPDMYAVVQKQDMPGHMTQREVCEEMFRLLNADPTDHPKTIRSMSVGDLVLVDGHLWVCKPVGFERIEDEAFLAAMKAKL